MFVLFLCFCIQYEQESILISIGGNASLFDHLIPEAHGTTAEAPQPLLLKFPLPMILHLKNLPLNILRLYRI